MQPKNEMTRRVKQQPNYEPPSDNKKIRLDSLREIPLEVMFSTNNAVRDQRIPNRWWFEFPDEWANVFNKDPILGIRSLYTTNGTRYVHFALEVRCWGDRVNDSPGDVVNESDGDDCVDLFTFTTTPHFWLDGGDWLQKLTLLFGKTWHENVDSSLTSIQSQGAFDQLFNDQLVKCWYDFSLNRCMLHFGRLPHQPMLTWTNTLGVNYNVHLNFKFTPISDDAVGMFGIENPIGSHGELAIPAWSRQSCYVKSSIASNTEDNFVGHTGRDMNPIKYYRLTSDCKKFWVELYESRDHDAIVELPHDGKSVLYIEGIVCCSSTGMLV